MQESNTKKFRFHKTAYGLVEGLGLSASFVVSGGISINCNQGTNNIYIGANASTTASFFGQVEFIGYVDLFIDGQLISSRRFTLANEVVYPEGMMPLGNAHFSISSDVRNVSLRIRAWYILFQPKGATVPFGKMNEIINIENNRL